MLLHADVIDITDERCETGDDQPVGQRESGQEPTAVVAKPRRSKDGRNLRRISAVVSIARYGNNVTRDNIESVCREIGVPLQPYHGVFWHHALQNAFMRFCEDGTEWILCFDADTMVHKGDIYTLLGHAKEPHIHAISALQPQRGSGNALMTRPRSRGTDDPCLLEVGSAHFGCTIIKVDALKRVPLPWFWEIPNKDGGWFKKAHTYGTHEALKEARKAMSGLHACDADIWFWNRWKDAGNTVYIDSEVRIGHAEEMVSYYDETGCLQHISLSQWGSILKDRELKWQTTLSGRTLYHEDIPQAPCEHPMAFEVVKFPWLSGRGYSEYSQFGEDGLLEAIFEKIGVKNKSCFEFGACDGVTFSATRRLREEGWHCLLIENDSDQFEHLRDKSLDVDTIVHETVTPENVNQLLSPLPDDCDLGIIDVDGDDYWIWNALHSIRPRVVVIEYNAYTLKSFLPKAGTPVLWDGNFKLPSGATLDHIRRLGEQKGYVLAAQTFCNAIFIDGNEL